jgi:hypothetical protein
VQCTSGDAKDANGHTHTQTHRQLAVQKKLDFLVARNNYCRFVVASHTSTHPRVSELRCPQTPMVKFKLSAPSAPFHLLCFSTLARRCLWVIVCVLSLPTYLPTCSMREAPSPTFGQRLSISTMRLTELIRHIELFYRIEAPSKPFFVTISIRDIRATLCSHDGIGSSRSSKLCSALASAAQMRRAQLRGRYLLI